MTFLLVHFFSILFYSVQFVIRTVLLNCIMNNLHFVTKKKLELKFSAIVFYLELKWRRMPSHGTRRSMGLIKWTFRRKESPPSSGYKKYMRAGRNVRRLLRNTFPSSRIFQASHSSETSVFTRLTQRHILEDAILHSHRRENLKSYTGRK
jgi:hypothetical protein